MNRAVAFLVAVIAAIGLAAWWGYGRYTESRRASVNQDLVRELGKGESADLIRVKELVRSGADPRLAGPSGTTALMVAVRRGDLDFVKGLLDGGASPNEPGPDGRTPLMLAAGEGLVDIVETLLVAGADVSRKDRDGHTALWWARTRGNPPTAQLIRSAGGKG